MLFELHDRIIDHFVSVMQLLGHLLHCQFFFLRFEFGDFVHDAIEQITIVRHDDDCTVIVVDRPFEKRFAIEVEVIVRFIKQE